jgi:hypothetical protein
LLLNASRLAGFDCTDKILPATGLLYDTDEHIQEDQEMIAVEKRVVALYVDRACPQHWIVRDPEGNFWIVPSGKNSWDNRQPFYPTEQTDLESVPGHYKYMLDLPF